MAITRRRFQLSKPYVLVCIGKRDYCSGYFAYIPSICFIQIQLFYCYLPIAFLILYDITKYVYQVNLLFNYERNYNDYKCRNKRTRTYY